MYETPIALSIFLIAEITKQLYEKNMLGKKVQEIFLEKNKDLLHKNQTPEQKEILKNLNSNTKRADLAYIY